MYTIQWATGFRGFSKEEPMDLHKFTLFYDEHIAERYFTYSTTSKKIPYFVIETKRNQLPHLMGLQHWNNLDVKQPEKQYERLINGEWDIPFIAAADNGSYKEYRQRIEFLPNLYNLLYHFECRVKLINKTIPSTFKNRKIDMIFQKDGVKWVYVLELRAKRAQEKATEIYVPTSITVHRKTANALQVKSEPLQIKDVLVDKIR